MKRLPAIQKQVEIDLLKEISELLQKGEIDLKTAKQAGRDYLTTLPFLSEDDIQKKVKTLVDKYPQLEKVYALLITYIDEEKTTDMLDKLRLYIHKTE